MVDAGKQAGSPIGGGDGVVDGGSKGGGAAIRSSGQIRIGACRAICRMAASYWAKGGMEENPSISSRETQGVRAASSP